MGAVPSKSLGRKEWNRREIAGTKTGCSSMRGSWLFVFCVALASASILKGRHSGGERCVFAGAVVSVRFLGVGCKQRFEHLDGEKEGYVERSRHEYWFRSLGVSPNDVLFLWELECKGFSCKWQAVWGRGARAAENGTSPRWIVKRYCLGRCRKMFASMVQPKRENITCV